MRYFWIILDLLCLIMVYIVWKDMISPVPILAALAGLITTCAMLFMFIFITLGKVR